MAKGVRRSGPLHARVVRKKNCNSGLFMSMAERIVSGFILDLLVDDLNCFFFFGHAIFVYFFIIVIVRDFGCPQYL